jgi:hypothetical protein
MVAKLEVIADFIPKKLKIKKKIADSFAVTNTALTFALQIKKR